MPRRVRGTIFSRSIQRTLKALTRSAVRAGTRAVKQALVTGTPAARQRAASKAKAHRPTKVSTAVKLPNGFTTGLAGVYRYRLFVPPGAHKTEPLPLLVMLHGCSQTSEAFATSTRMNQIAAKEGFAVLYPEQNQLANLQGCWNWHQSRSGKAQTEADAILATILQVCQRVSVDPGRIALAGLSAGASMAALLAIRHPARFRAIAMHSGIAPGMAHSLADALKAMRGHSVATPLSALAAGAHLPALLVIQGSADPLVAPANGLAVAQLWAAREGANPARPRSVKRGARHPSTLTDYKTKGRLVATLCAIHGLGHAWSGGAASQAYSDPKGPDASRMIWAFAAKQFAKPF
jgi:poly(hydroxyalkanoate) depolymerase family esterase